MSVLIRFLLAVWNLVIGAAADGLQWLRRPGSKIKLVCAVLAFGCMVSGLTAYEKEQRIRDLSAQVIKVRADWKADAARLQADVDTRDQRLAEVASALRAEAEKLEALRAESADALRHLSVVRYDAFGDVGGHLSWSLAVLDDAGHGVVLTSIHGRSEARTYAKSIASWSCEQQLSPEEEEAIEHARP